MKQKRLVMRSSILAVIAIALAYTFYSNFIADRSVAKAGDLSVNFVLHDLEGERIELEDLKGKGVFLNFWGTYCPPCVKEMPIMEELYAEYKHKGVEIIAVNAAEPGLTVQRFAERHGLTFPIAIDTKRNVIDAYGISPLPTTILINEHGTIVRVHQGGMTEQMVRNFMEEIKPG
ncbi:thiol-disulfide oxidoreductase ResA [Halalkalibacter akibai]|uniref:Cytochrome c-type biogenesis protein ResA n=1 Tax=Halalkalibacter akibai (strain ATCC 43226 / DSM 21942 / CIP 109018 / JCM 9157 / 1139) TaxID=1236973 RepID=W4QW49_HALA3|nr:thiol-disulfide oxidoreductase ResA [Halalkalibacter akibai]GAE35863.1 cytochrome c-type biogenesis protein ResA [Halalkalibacter akibai JCM 9157]